MKTDRGRFNDFVTTVLYRYKGGKGIQILVYLYLWMILLQLFRRSYFQWRIYFLNFWSNHLCSRHIFFLGLCFFTLKIWRQLETSYSSEKGLKSLKQHFKVQDLQVTRERSNTYNKAFEKLEQASSMFELLRSSNSRTNIS